MIFFLICRYLFIYLVFSNIFSCSHHKQLNGDLKGFIFSETWCVFSIITMYIDSLVTKILKIKVKKVNKTTQDTKLT